MKLIPVDTMPKAGGYHKLQELIEEFVNSDAKIVKVDFNEDDYKSPTVCRSCLASSETLIFFLLYNSLIISDVFILSLILCKYHIIKV